MHEPPGIVQSHNFLRGSWCNGSTFDFDSKRASSSPAGPEVKTT